MYTLSAKVHSVCVNYDFITLCIFTDTECTFTLSVYVFTPTRDFITLIIFTQTECTQCVVLHTVCNKEMFCIYTQCRRLQKHTPLCKTTVCIITHVV